MKPYRLTINDGPMIAHAVETALDNEFRPSA
jgi:tryptophan synthase alpha subunit